MMTSSSSSSGVTYARYSSVPFSLPTVIPVDLLHHFKHRWFLRKALDLLHLLPPKSLSESCPMPPNFLAGAPQRRRSVSPIPAELVRPRHRLLVSSYSLTMDNIFNIFLDFIPQRIDGYKIDPRTPSATTTSADDHRRSRKMK